VDERLREHVDQLNWFTTTGWGQTTENKRSSVLQKMDISRQPKELCSELLVKQSVYYLQKYIYRLKGSKLCYSKKIINIEIFNLVSNKLSNKAYRLFTVSKKSCSNISA